MINLQVSPNFNLYYDRKLACPCCHLLPITIRFCNHMTLLQELRDAVGFAIRVNSGYRCPKHNKAVGGAMPDPKIGKVGSQHLIFATDITPVSGSLGDLERMWKWSNTHFTGVGLYKTFIHVDLREVAARWNG